MKAEKERVLAPMERKNGVKGLEMVNMVMMIVGDYRHDTEAGRAAGTLTVLLTNGKTPTWEVDADLVIERMGELGEYLVDS